ENDFYLRTLVRASLAAADWLRGQLGQAERSLAEVLAERRTAGEGYLATRVCHDLGQVQRAQGNLDAALAPYRQALNIAGEVSSQPPHLGMAHVGRAEVLYERDELAAALDHATRGVTLCRQLAFTPPLAAGLAILARIRQAHGDTAAAVAAMGEAGQVELSPQVVALLNPVPSQRARLLLAQGDVSAAAQWAKAAGLSSEDEPDYPREPAYLLLARVLLAQDRPGPALTLLQRLLDTAASQGRIGSVIEVQALPGLALAARGDHAGALGALAEAVTLACPQGYVRVFADEGAPMRALLTRLSTARKEQRAPARDIDPDYLAGLLRASGQAGAAPLSGGAAAAAGRGQGQSAHRLRTGGGARHGEKARDPHPGQARGRQPHRGRRTGPAARPDPLTLHPGRPVAPSCEGSPRSDVPPGMHLWVTPHPGGNS